MWWGVSTSLSPPCVPLVPGPKWWIEDSVKRARRSIRSPKTWAILCTGRPDSPPLRFRIAELLKNKNLNFDEVYLSQVRSGSPRHGKAPVGWSEWSWQQATYKLKVILNLLRLHPHIDTVQIWEDHDEHLPWFVKQIEAAGTRCIPHYVVATPHKPLCTSPFEAKRNPIGRPADVKAWGGKGALVRIGERGKLTHVYVPPKGRKTERTLCRSGADLSRGGQEFYRSNANYITCYRCAKLATMNIQDGRAPWDAGR